jgi:hypothetical protein
VPIVERLRTHRQPGLPQPFLDISPRALRPGRAGPAPFHGIGGQHGDVRSSGPASVRGAGCPAASASAAAIVITAPAITYPLLVRCIMCQCVDPRQRLHRIGDQADLD